MRKSLILLGLLFLFSLPASAQVNGYYSNIALRFNSGFPAYPAAGAVITVCPATGIGQPCVPTATICGSAIDIVCSVANPFNADANGNFGFWAPPGVYLITITGANVAGYSLTANIGPQFGSNATYTGNLTFSGTVTFSNTALFSALFQGSTTFNGAATFNAGVTTNALTIDALNGCLQAVAGVITSTGSACGSSGGAVTVTGSPVNGNLTKFSSATSITNGDLSGDCATAGTLSVTCTKVNGVFYANSPSINTVPIVTASNTTTYIPIPNCAYLSYNTATSSFSCSSVPSVNFGRNSSVCSTGGSGGSTCTTTITLSSAEPDTNYSVAVSCINPSGYPIILGVTKFTGSVSVKLSNGTANMAVASTCAELDAVVTGT